MNEKENEYEPVPKKIFMPELERQEHIPKSHSAILTAKTCLRKYFFSKVLRRRPKGIGKFPPLAWGSCYHLFRELLFTNYNSVKYDKEESKKAYGVAFSETIKEFNKYNFDQIQDPKWQFMTLERFMRTMIVAYEYWDRELQRGVLVDKEGEQYVVCNIEGTDYYTSGVLDKTTEWHGKEWVRDYKATSKNIEFYKKSLTPSDQFTRYIYMRRRLSGKKIPGVLVEVMYNNKDTKNKQHGPEITALLANRTEWEIDDWIEDEIFFRKILENCREEDRWPKSEVACTFCEYYSVCERSSEAGQVNQLKRFYQIDPGPSKKVIESEEKV